VLHRGIARICFVLDDSKHNYSVGWIFEVPPTGHSIQIDAVKSGNGDFRLAFHNDAVKKMKTKMPSYFFSGAEIIGAEITR